MIAKVKPDYRFEDQAARMSSAADRVQEILEDILAVSAWEDMPSEARDAAAAVRGAHNRLRDGVKLLDSLMGH